MNKEKLTETLHPLERKVIPYLKENSTLDELVKQTKLKDVEVMRALQWLENKEILKIKTEVKELIKLDSNGEQYLKEGLPEKKFLKELKKEGPKKLDYIKLSKEEKSISIGLLRKKSAINIKEGMLIEITGYGEKLLEKESLEEKFLKVLPKSTLNLSPEEQFAFKELKKRKKIIKSEVKKEKTINLTETGKWLIKQKIDSDLIDGLTPKMIKSGTWKNKKFRRYDVKINVPKISKGRRHPYNESMNIIRNAFLEMGFQEMQGPWVETAFWNMDSMWIPQDHPARDVQDTFYLDQKGDLPKDKALLKKVKASHENGYNTGSTGHTKEWDPELAKELILRTHSTATTFRYLYNLKSNKDCKYFYIADNFRNEAIDATHLPEFGQAEGFIMGDNLTLADLMGFIKEFYKKLGITKIRFKPTFNPYTEPSMEAHYYNEKLGKWYALINSGIFRPEALAPYGIKKSVIAWGMGSSRIAAILTGKKKLKDLFGPEVDLDWIKTHKRIKCL